MNDDILENLKKNRFIIIPVELLDTEQMVILMNAKFWVDHLDELDEWCKQRNSKMEGMTVVFPDEITLMEFVLKWE